MTGVRVVRRTALMCSNDIREALLIMKSKPVARALCRRSFKVIQVAVALLINYQAVSHMLKHFGSELLSRFAGEVHMQPLSVHAGFVHTYKPDGREVIAEGSKIPLGIRIQASIQELRDYRPFGLQRPRGQIH